MNIQLAFCVEMDQVVNIFQARDFYFSHNSQEDLNFLCFDETCRRIKRPVVIGVNYRKLIEKGDYVVNRLHFREHYKYSHYNLCPEFELEEAIKEVEDEPSPRYGFKRNAKLSNVVDIFTPYEEKDDMPPKSQQDIIYDGIRRITDRRTRLKALKDYVRAARTRSSILQEVVTSFENLSIEQRKHTPLQINGQKKNYLELFNHISNYENHRASIFYGGASVKNYPKDGKIIGYVLNFYDNVTVGGSSFEVSLFISKFKLENFKYGTFLSRQLDAAAGKKDIYVKCYFWGSLVQSPKEGKMSVNIEHFNNLHISLKHKNYQRLKTTGDLVLNRSYLS